MADRDRDVTAVLNALAGWLGGHVDVSRAGVMGHSRGTVTALAAAGGSAPWSAPTTPVTVQCVPTQPADGLCWPLQRRPPVKAVMGMAIGAQPIVLGVDLANIKVPTLLVAGKEDDNSLPATSKFAHERITGTTDNTLLELPARPTAVSTRPTARSCSLPARPSTQTTTGSSARPRPPTPACSSTAGSSTARRSG